MSQSLAEDFPIDPTTTSGTALADILNRFNEAVNTSNSGATAPPDTYPGQMWLDTSGGDEGVLKFRNAANSAWITMSTPGGATGLLDGTVAAPGLSFLSEPGLGLYRVGAGRAGLAAAGAQIAEWGTGNITAKVPLRVADGTLAAPSLAFASETGMGWYRPAAGQIALAQGGVQRALFNFTATPLLTLNTPLSIISGAGTYQISLKPAVAGAAVLATLPSGANNGSYWNAYSNVYPGDSTRIRWQMSLGNGAPETGGNAGNNFQLLAFNDAGGAPVNALTILRNNLTATFGGTTISPRFQLGSDSNAAFTGNASSTYIYFHPSYFWMFDRSNGQLLWQGNTGYVKLSDGNLEVSAQGYKPGGGDWVAISDERVKDVRGAYTSGLDAILALEPILYNYKGDDTTRVGLLAQKAKRAMPELVTVGPGKWGDVEYDDLHQLDSSPVTWALVNATKTLHERISALEGGTAPDPVEPPPVEHRDAT